MNSRGILAPLIPERPLSWNGVPLFHVDVFPKDFSGKIFFILGQGLGDHVNGFRILHEVKTRFPMAKCVVYADRRWEEFVQRFAGIQIRWYPKAMDVRSRVGTNNPYDPAFLEIKAEANSSPGQAYLGYAHFPMPDRHARHETTLESAARAIGLSLNPVPRPFLPILPSDLELAEEFLKKFGLEKGKYAVIAPFTWPDRVWSKDRFSSLIDELYEKFGIRSIVVSFPDIGPFSNKGVVCAFDLTLGQLAGLLSGARLYVGLDSGPSHMAATFNIPMVVVFVTKKIIPFEVRPLSPRALLVVESFFNRLPEAQVKTVCDSVSYLLGEEKSERPLIPSCPVCGGGMNHVVKSNGSCLRLMCSCGIALDQSFSNPSSQTKKIPAQKTNSPTSPLHDLTKEIETLESFRRWNSSLEDESLKKIEWVILSDNNDLTSPLDPGRLIMGFDGLLMWMRGKGFHLAGLRRVASKDERKNVEAEEVVSFERKGQGSLETGKKMDIPWNGVRLKVTEDQYVRWYSFKRYSDPQILVGVVKSQTGLGFPRKERIRCALVAFHSKKEFRSFRWVVKSIYL